MIRLTRLNNEVFYLNPMHIEQAELSPDLTLTLSNGKKIVIREDLKSLIEDLQTYWRSMFHLDEKIQSLKH